MMYWTTGGDGRVMKMDKFGRGHPVEVAGNLPNPMSLKLFHESKYNRSLAGRCDGAQCSHLCLLIQGGYKCMCPSKGNKVACDATIEPPKAEPLVCRCQNGGTCQQTDDGQTSCRCEDNFVGQFCDVKRNQ